MKGTFQESPEEQPDGYGYNAFEYSADILLDPFPEAEPMLWDADEEAKALVCASLFVTEFLWDHSPVLALMRLGLDKSAAKMMAKEYQAHWLVQRMIRERIQKFRTLGIATTDVVLAAMHRDATDFSQYSNPVSRVAAQKAMAKVLGMEPEDKRKGAAEDKPGFNDGGVMVIPGAEMSVEEFEAEFMPQQAAAKQKVLL